jgi:lysophospholipase L1-like esterase
MANIAAQNNVIAVIGTVIPTSRSAAFNQVTIDINQGIRGLSNVVIAESRMAVGEGFDLLADDVHLSTAGQQQVAAAFVDVIR